MEKKLSKKFENTMATAAFAEAGESETAKEFLKKQREILLATDGSEYSEGAIREAINLAKSCDGQIYAMSAIQFNPQFLAAAPRLFQEIEKETKEHLEGVKDRVVKENVACETIIREGQEPYKLIIEEADKKQVWLIVMGRRGRTGIKRLLMGSVTARVIGHTLRDVLIVPRAAFIKFKNIVVATDGSKYSEAAAEAAMDLIKRCNPTCTLNAIAVLRKEATAKRAQIAERALSKLKADAEKENIKVSVSLFKGKAHESIHDAIIEFAGKKDADIIAMGSHGRTGLEKLLMGSVTERVIGHTEKAVLVAHAK